MTMIGNECTIPTVCMDAQGGIADSQLSHSTDMSLNLRAKAAASAVAVLVCTTCKTVECSC